MHQRHVISLLIHGFLSVNARLLIAFGTAFYAIISLKTRLMMLLMMTLLESPQDTSTVQAKLRLKWNQFLGNGNIINKLSIQ